MPAKSEVEIDYIPDGARPTGWMVEVQWRGKPVSMFLIDLLERGEALDGLHGQNHHGNRD